MGFDEWSDTWYENHKDNIKATTQEGYKYTLRILKDHFGRRKLSEIKAMDIEQFLKKLRRDGKSDSTLAQCRGMLYQIFNKAAVNDIILKNPVAYADKMRRQPKKRKEAYTADEVPRPAGKQNRLVGACASIMRFPTILTAKKQPSGRIALEPSLVRLWRP